MLAHQLRSQCPLSFSPSGTLGSQELRLRRGCVCVCVAVWLCVCVCVCVCVCLKASPLSLLPLCAYLSGTWSKFRLLRRV